jgi:predicted acyltransferase
MVSKPSYALDAVSQPARAFQPQPSRVRSIDIFRGVTMLVMTFVNDVSGVKGLPWWTYHMDPNLSGMTYVDVVFPAFLFVLGMSIPLAIRKRLEQGDSGDSMRRLWTHIIGRSLSLIVLGLVLANAWNADAAATHMPSRVWAAAAVTGAILFWLVYPSTPGRQGLYRALKYAGLFLLALMLALFRRKTDAGQLAWLDFSYWEILGLIGRTYLAVCILYVPLRKKPWAPVALLALLTAWNVASRFGLPPVTRVVPYWLWPFDSGELPSVAMAGIVCSSIFVNRDGWRVQTKATLALVYAATLFVAGFGFRFLGISKNAATPTWCLWSSGISVVLFLVIYYLADVRRWQRWAALVKPAGSNTLLTYLLPDLFYFSGLYTLLPAAYGWPGVLRSLVFTVLILQVSSLLTKKGIRMQL